MYAKSLGIVNIASDIILYILPMRTVWKLKMPRRKRIGVVALFAIGFLMVVMGCLRMRALARLARTADQTWDKVPAHLWSLGEINVAIFVTSAPSFKPIYNAILGLKKKGMSAYGSGETGATTNSNQSGNSTWRQTLARRQRGYPEETFDLQDTKESTADLTMTASQKESIVYTAPISPVELEAAYNVENSGALEQGGRVRYGVAVTSPPRSYGIGDGTAHGYTSRGPY